MIVFRETKRCQHPHSTQFFQKAKIEQRLPRLGPQFFSFEFGFCATLYTGCLLAHQIWLVIMNGDQTSVFRNAPRDRSRRASVLSRPLTFRRLHGSLGRAPPSPVCTCLGTRSRIHTKSPLALSKGQSGAGCCFSLYSWRLHWNQEA